MRYVYDAGALVAIDKKSPAALLRHEKRLAARDEIIVPAPVAAQVVREPRRQARLMLTLRGCGIVPFTEKDAAPVGALLGRAGTWDVVDGFVALTAATSHAAIVSSDGDDMRHLLDTMGVRIPVYAP